MSVASQQLRVYQYSPHDIRPPQPEWAHSVDHDLRALYRGLHLRVARDVELDERHAVIEPERLPERVCLRFRAHADGERECGPLWVVVEVLRDEAAREACKTPTRRFGISPVG